MKMIKVATLAVFTACIVSGGVLGASLATPTMAPHGAPSVEADVPVEIMTAQAILPDVITLPEVRIVAQHKATKRAVAQVEECVPFAAQEMAQGPVGRLVRGFCGGGL